MVPAGEDENAIEAGTEGVYVSHLYSAKEPFVFYRVPVQVHYNLARGSAVNDGNLCDGASIGDSPVIFPSQDGAFYDARERLLSFFEQDRQRSLPYETTLEDRARKLCAMHDITLEELLSRDEQRSRRGFIRLNIANECGRRGWLDYGNIVTFPILKALFAMSSFVVLKGVPGCGIVNGKLDSSYLSRVVHLEALAKTAVVVQDGLLVAAPHRLVIVMTVVLFACAVTALCVYFDGRAWIERFESAVFVFALILFTIPGVVSLISSEPNLIKCSLRGKKTLTTQSQVSRHFKLSTRDYAMLCTRINGSKLVSSEVGCFLTGEERGTHKGDEPAVRCEDVAPFGLICGRSVHYRACWQWVRVSNRLPDMTSHLTDEEPKVDYWVAGVPEGTWVR